MASDAPRWPGPVENWVLPFLRNGHLRPVVIAILGHVAILMALPLLATWRTGRPDEGAVLFLLVMLTGLPMWSEWRIERRAGPFTACVLSAWAGAVIIAIWGARTGVL